MDSTVATIAPRMATTAPLSRTLGQTALKAGRIGLVVDALRDQHERCCDEEQTDRTPNGPSHHR
jgi:hypothetical protein